MKIVTIAILEPGDVKLDSFDIPMINLTEENINVKLPRVDAVMMGPEVISNQDVLDRLKENLDDFGHFCFLPKVKHG